MYLLKQNSHNNNTKATEKPWVLSGNDVLFSSADSVQLTGTVSVHVLHGTGLLSLELQGRCWTAARSFIAVIRNGWLLLDSALQKFWKLFSDPFSKYRNIHSLRSHSTWTPYNYRLFDIIHIRIILINLFFLFYFILNFLFSAQKSFFV